MNTRFGVRRAATTHADEYRTDELPAESPVEAGPEPDHLVDVVHETVHTCRARGAVTGEVIPGRSRSS